LSKVRFGKATSAAAAIAAAPNNTITGLNAGRHAAAIHAAAVAAEITNFYAEATN
jgi:hypothetical protein